MKTFIIGAFALLALSNGALSAVSVTVNGTGYPIPQTNEKGWGVNVTTWIQAISANTLQPTGGLFTLSADLDLGATFGIKSTYYKSRTLNPAATGQVRLANADSITFRNFLNTGDLLLTPGAVDGQLNYNGVLLDTISSATTLTNKTLTGPIISTISNTGTLTLPTSTDVLVGRATTDTLTNKTINGTTNTLTAIPNGSTTATNLNTTSAIVARDGSGNFSAGIISAALVGNVTGNASNISGLAGVVNGGTGVATLTTNSLLVGNGTAAVTGVAPGTLNNVLKSNGTIWVSTPSSFVPVAPTKQIFTASGTYTPTSASIIWIKITTIGGGGGSGASGAASGSAGGGGGGGGGGAILYTNLAAIGASKAVTIGAGGAINGTGGTSSVGVLVVASGGVGGGNAIGSTTTVGGAGAGGIGTAGDQLFTGQGGGSGTFGTASVVVGNGGGGGNSALGYGGGAPGTQNGLTNGVVGGLYGGGASGGCSSGGTGTTGAAGYVLVEEFYQ